MSRTISAFDQDKNTLGLWTYMMTDIVLFAGLFATFITLRAYGGETGANLFDLPYVLTQTIILLASSFTAGMFLLWAKAGRRAGALAWGAATFALGAAFLTLELVEFGKLVAEGNDWGLNGFMSGFFTLVGLHGLHIAVGLLWLLILMIRTARGGLNPMRTHQISLFTIFWHFLDIVWIFIFTVVYLWSAL